ncbi:MAG: hypothetical protein B6D44_06605 [Ignavibacteriales bacterium UTCHB2]|nr:MAG: hypothetical protein B6D44_06605 [Ignavibacteriales bacterium UTCHB2]
MRKKIISVPDKQGLLAFLNLIFYTNFPFDHVIRPVTNKLFFEWLLNLTFDQLKTKRRLK